MNDRDLIGILSDFRDLIFEVEVGQLSDIRLLNVVDRFWLGETDEDYYQDDERQACFVCSMDHVWFL